MFTGIIEEIGTLRSRKQRAQGAVLSIAAERVLGGLQPGDSIAVNGACLTATGIAGGMFSCDLSTETIRRTTLGMIREGAPVNLERPLAAGGRLGGHFVQGHVDGVGRLRSGSSGREGAELVFEYPVEIERYLVEKGSIAVDGISLTIASLQARTFSVAVIPYTLGMTSLGCLTPGESVNIEVDILAKYVERFLQTRSGGGQPPTITAEYLREQGF